MMYSRLRLVALKVDDAMAVDNDNTDVYIVLVLA